MRHYYVEGQRYYSLQNEQGEHVAVTKDKTGKVQGWKEKPGKEGRVQIIVSRTVSDALKYWGDQGFK